MLFHIYMSQLKIHFLLLLDTAGERAHPCVFSGYKCGGHYKGLQCAEAGSPRLGNYAESKTWWKTELHLEQGPVQAVC